MKKKKNSYIKYVLILFTILILFFILTCDNKESEEEFQDLVENEDPLNVEDSAALDQWVDSSIIY